MGDVVKIEKNAPVSKEAEREALLSSVQAKNSGKRLAMVVLAPGVAIFAHPSQEEYRLFEKAMADPHQTAPQAYSLCAMSTVVYPSKEVFGQWLSDYPGIPMNKKLIDALNRLNGSVYEEEGK